MTTYTLDLNAIKQDQRSQTGGKGHTLAQLSQTGFAVPAGYVITVAAYRAFVAANNLAEPIATALALEQPAASAARIRAAFEQAPMPPVVAAAIRESYRELGEGAVAVRSSALAEDSAGASFAGQHETLLNVSGSEQLLDAVRRCWASLWSERALAYRRRLSAPPTETAMAVVVQNMAPAAQSGVAFTLDPVSGRRDVTIIEAVIGPGEALVSGQVTPFHYAVPQEITRAKMQKIANTLLDVKRLQTVVRLARQVEGWAGAPQDIEWSLDEAGRVHLLQARPITSPTEQAEVTRWTRDNVGEVLPDPVTPLSWSVLDPLGNNTFAGILRRLGLRDYPDGGLFGHFYGRVYFNQTLFQSMMGHFYLSQAGWRAAPRLAQAAIRAAWLLLQLPLQARLAIRAILAQRRSDSNAPAQEPQDKILARLNDWRQLGVRAMETHLTVSVIAELLYQTLDKLLTRWGDGSVNAATLAAGLTGLRSAQAGQALSRLAQQTHRNGDLRALIIASTPETLPARLAETDDGQALWAQIEAFLVEHGHSAVQEFELAAPRWRDDPTAILNAIQAQARAPRVEKQPVDPRAARRAAVRKIQKQMNWPQRLLFRLLLRQTQAFTTIRENLKYHFVIAHSRLRDLYLALAAHAVAAGQLEQDDVFFLTHDELVDLLQGRLAAHESAQRVGSRRQEWQEAREITPPFALDQSGDHLRDVARPDEQALSGFAASPGSYTGRARVVLTPEQGADLEPGEVLVAPATSPGWAPLLLTAGALITEIGGTLSHGAIIAREYGLPAVLNVTDATRRIHTGQLIHVDGSQGTIQLLEGAS
jgi:phosphohistidine swiveling domain-containing protein